MKAHVLSDKDPKKLAAQIEAFAGGEISIEHVGYAVDGGRHHALVLYLSGAQRRRDLAPLVERFIADTLAPAEPAP